MTHKIFVFDYSRRVLLRLRTTILIAAMAMSLCALAAPANAQNRNAAEIRGTVHDSSGGVVQNVSVTAKNTATGQLVTGKTNASGIYDFPYVPPGPYVITFAKNGYEQETKTNLVLTVDVITVDADLSVGSSTTQVTVNSSNAPLLQTESAEIGTTMNTEMVTSLPNAGGNGDQWSNLLSIAPGVTGARINGGGASGEAGGQALSGAYVAFNGSEANEMDITTNGAQNFTIQAHDPEWQTQPLDAIADVVVSSGDFGAESGNGTGVIDLVIKGGTNQFHGSAYEMVENTVFNAHQWGIKTPPITHYNLYGFSVGGPILKNRLFFFNSTQWNPRRSPESGFYTVPSNAVRGIGEPNGDAAFDPSIYGTVYDPATEQVVNGVEVRQPFPNNTIPAARFNSVSTAVLQYYPLANQAYTNGSNYSWAGVQPRNDFNWVYRGDFDMTKSNRISAIGSIVSLPYFGPTPGTGPAANYFGEGASPYGTQSYGVTDAWTPSLSVLNQLRFSLFRVNRDYYCNDTNAETALGLQNVPYDVFPGVAITGGAQTPFALDSCSPKSGANDHLYSLSDGWSKLKGKQMIQLGGEWDYMSSASLPSESAGSFHFNGNATVNPNINTTTGVAAPTGGSGLADFILGDVDSWSNTIPIAPTITDWLLQYYAQDAYKVRTNLTVTFGLRAQYQTGLKEIEGRYENFEPTLINPATNTPGAVAYGSVSLGNSMETNRWFYMPRLGVSWSPRANWVVRGGFGLYVVPWATTVDDAGVGNGYSAFGSSTQTANDFEPVMQFNSPSPNLTHPTSADLTPSLLNGQSVTYLPKDIPSEYQEQYSVGIQHVIAGYLFDVSWIGADIHNKIFSTNHTQIPASELGVSTHPFPQYSGVTYALRTGWGNYNGLQVQSRKQFSHGFTYLATYTYSKDLDTGTGCGLQNGCAVDAYQNAYLPSANYGPSEADTRHMLNGGIVYQLPFGRDRLFLNHSGLLNQIVGGWQVGSIFQWHSGTPFTPTVGSEPFADSGLFSGDDWYANRIGSGKLSHPTLSEFFNANDFTVPADNTLGDTGRNVVYGPRYSDIDLSVAKSFPIHFLGEAASLQLKGDAFDVMNHFPWGQPRASIYGTPALNAKDGAGAITSHLGGRQMQFGAHLRF
jgi:hypothetical protein